MGSLTVTAGRPCDKAFARQSWGELALIRSASFAFRSFQDNYVEPGTQECRANEIQSVPKYIMDVETAHKLIDWVAPGSNPGLAAEALADKTIQIVHESGSTRAVGHCPLCLAPMNLVLAQAVVMTFIQRVRRATKAPVVSVVDCRCGFEHPNAPKDEKGCGMAITVRFDAKR